MEGLNDVNRKRGMDDSYSRLKTKVQKCSVDMMVMKAENEHLKKFKEEITLKQLEMERHVIAQQQMYTQMQMELECELRKYRQMHEELKLQKGDADGNFKNGVNRYIYETYYKLHSTVATRDCPWCVCVTGDEARVNFRGKGITMCGVKQSDPRLPSQFATGKTMNQSRNLYSPAIAGYTNEKSNLSY
jgi:hypothetical protein